MKKIVYLSLALSCLIVNACRSTKKIQTAISKKDTAQVVLRNDTNFDSAGFIGNPVYFDRNNIVSVKLSDNAISLSSLGTLFKHFITISNTDYVVLNSKLDDHEPGRSRTAVLEYDDYETKGTIHFSTKRKISV